MLYMLVVEKYIMGNTWTILIINLFQVLQPCAYAHIFNSQVYASEKWYLCFIIYQVVLCKFHTVFLSHRGEVFTCGHGRGGRLGHKNEQSIIVSS